MLFLGLPRALWSFTNTNNVNSQRKARCLSAGWSHDTRTIEGVVRLPVTCRTGDFSGERRQARSERSCPVMIFRLFPAGICLRGLLTPWYVGPGGAIRTIAYGEWVKTTVISCLLTSRGMSKGAYIFKSLSQPAGICSGYDHSHNRPYNSRPFNNLRFDWVVLNSGQRISFPQLLRGLQSVDVLRCAFILSVHTNHDIRETSPRKKITRTHALRVEPRGVGFSRSSTGGMGGGGAVMWQKGHTVV